MGVGQLSASRIGFRKVCSKHKRISWGILGLYLGAGLNRLMTMGSSDRMWDRGRILETWRRRGRRVPITMMCMALNLNGG